MDYMIDDAPAKSGFFTPGSHFAIFGNCVLDERPPDYLVIFAWAFFDEIAKKCEKHLDKGVRLITPLPDVRITATPNFDAQPNE